MGEIPPEGSKSNVDGANGLKIFKSKTDFEKKIIQRMLGLEIKSNK